MNSSQSKHSEFEKHPSTSLQKDEEIRTTKKIIFTLILLLIPVIFILILETALRLFDYGGNLDLFVLRTAPYSEFVLNENFTKRYFFQKGIKTPIPLSQRFPAQKDSSTYRIFCLGASTTQGFPYSPNAGYPARLENILTDFFPERKIQVINCGITAITSHSVLDMEREILNKYQPDLLIIYTGHNEFYGVLGQASNLALYKNRNLLKLFLRMQRSKVFLLMRDTLNIFFGKKIERGQNQQATTLMRIMAKDAGIRFNSDLFRRTKQHYEKNLIDMCRLAQKHKTGIMLCNLVDNLRDLPPFANEHDINFTAQDTSRWHQLIKSAQNLQGSALYQDAASQYQNALQIDSTCADTHYRLGQCYDALQNYGRAKEHFLLAKDYDTIRFRAPSVFNEILKKVSQECDVPLVDVENSFAERSVGGIPGQNLLHEHVHPNMQGYLLIAQTIAKKMANHGFISERWDWTLQKPDSTYIAQCRLTQLDHEVVNYTLFRLTSQWPFSQKSSTSAYRRVGDEKTEELAKSFVDGGKKSLVELHLDYGNEFHQKNEFQQALDEYLAALAIQPLDITYNRLGRLYLRKTEIAYRDQGDYARASANYQNGVYYFTEGLKRWPEDIGLNFNLGLLYFMRNDETEAAIAQFQKVIALESSHKNAYKYLIELYIRQRELAKAKTLLQQAIEHFPEDARFYTDLGFIYLQENNLSESERWLEKALRLNNDPKAQRLLQQVRSKLGK